MALSNVSYLGNGSNRLFSVTFPYLSKPHVKVFIAGVEDTTFTWTTSSSITTTGIPANLAIVLIKRVTPTVPLVDYVDGSTLTEALLDSSTVQSLYVSEEVADALAGTLLLDTTDNKFNATSKVIKNVANPVSPQDAATKSYVDSTTPASAAAALASQNAAATSASNALASETAAAISYDSFDDRYLGVKTSNPTLDNDANALLTGALYFNSATNEMRVYTGTVWQVTYNVGTISLSTGQAFNDSISTLASSATPNIWANQSNLINYTGIVTATGFAAAPQAGVRRTLILADASSFTAGANMLIDGVVSFTGAAGDEIEVEAVSTTQFRLRPKRVSGTSIVARIASTTVRGESVLATAAEIKTGADTGKAIVSAALLSAQGFTGYFESSPQTITSAGLLTIAHGLGRAPTMVTFKITNTVAEFGYSVGDILWMSIGSNPPNDTTPRGISIVTDASNLVIRYGSAAIALEILHKTTGVRAGPSNASWVATFAAWG